MRQRLFVFFALLCAMSAPRAVLAATDSQPMVLVANFPVANTYYIAYIDFLKVTTALAVPANSYLEFDEFIPADSAGFSGSVDMYSATGGSWNGKKDLRDFQSPTTNEYIRDQNYLRAHPFSDVSAYAKGQWYHRRFDMGSAANQPFTEACLALDNGNAQQNGVNGSPQNLAGMYNCYIDNVTFTNAYGVTVTPSLYLDGAGSLNMTGAPNTSTTIMGGAGATASTYQVSIASGLSLAAAPASAVVGSSITLGEHGRPGRD